MKKILLLGGSQQQIIAIESAKKLGYYTILCDYLIDNPGQYVADKFYLISTTDKEAILKVAREEKIDGILAYASDPAAPTAAYVGERLGLPTNPYKSVNTLCNKDQFRSFLSENDFNTPFSKGYSNNDDIVLDLEKFELPVIIKPVDSSGSKGATVLHSWDGLNEALDFAFSFSRSHRIIVEEFIEKKHDYLVGGDIFVVDGKVKLWGLLNCHRDNRVNPLVPVGKSYPLALIDSDINNIKDTLQKMITKLGINFGSVNVEMVVDKKDRVWPIDIGPRAGGNMIPDLLEMIYNVDIVTLAVKTAMGESVVCNPIEDKVYYATHNLHTSRNGEYKDIQFSDKLKPYIIKKCLYKKDGDSVEFFDNAAKALGIIFMKFEDSETQREILTQINDLYNVEVY